MYFRRGSILESPGSMVQLGEFLITVDPVRLNTTKQDQQDPKTMFMRCHDHARARHCLFAEGWRAGCRCCSEVPQNKEAEAPALSSYMPFRFTFSADDSQGERNRRKCSNEREGQSCCFALLVGQSTGDQ